MHIHYIDRATNASFAAITPQDSQYVVPVAGDLITMPDGKRYVVIHRFIEHHSTDLNVPPDVLLFMDTTTP